MSSKFEKFTKEELLALVEKQEGELASKKYGLVWDAEREPEQVVLDCEHHLPVLKRVKGKEIKTALDQQDNILIEGDNYHALTVLNYTHQGKVDVIYIDPPYNTGNQDFKYNDKFVDKEDGFRHSKWLNFMEKRLRLAKDLLSDKGVIFISIDDNEIFNLKLLGDKIFGENNFVGNFIVNSAPAGTQSSRNISVQHSYCLVFSRNIFNIKFNITRTISELKDRYKEKDELGNYYYERLWKRGQGGKKEDVPTLHFPVFYNPISKKILIDDEYKKQKKFIKIIPYQTKGVLGRWTWSRDTMKENRKFLFVKKVAGEYKLHKKVYEKDESGKLPFSIIDSSIGRTEMGGLEIKEIFSGEKVFAYPKPINLMKHLIHLSNNKSSIILDFFAGSGTTGHAVLELNKEDSGNRKFILCTNNENNICEGVTYPRLQKVIKGYKKNGNSEKVEGLVGNLQYFKTDLIKKTKNKDQMRIDLTQKCTDMLCVKENIFNLEIEQEDYKIFSSNQKDQFLCVYYNFYDESFDDFVKEIKKLKGHKKIYMFSMDGKTDKKLFAGVKDFDLEEIPQKIIEIYKQLVKMNIPVKAETIFLDFEKAQKRIFEDQDKDEGARILRIVLEKTLQKIAQKNSIAILDDKGKEEKIVLVNDRIKDAKIITKVQWEENKTYLTIGNHASHGDYDEYNLKQVEQFYKHIQELHNSFGI